ncbi:MAG: hypothetical protein ACI9U2_004531 [Bradymonadia bacterium]|jgi:hypothetical protein
MLIDRHWFSSLARRHGVGTLMIADETGQPAFTLVSQKGKRGIGLRPAPKSYARILCRLAVTLYPNPSGVGPGGERIHQTPFHADQRYTLVTVGNARAHEALVVEALPHLLGHLAA